MIKRIAVAAAAALLSLGPARAQQEESVIAVTCKTPSFKVRRPILVLNGTCTLPDGVYLKINMTHMIEQVMGPELSPMYIAGGSGNAVTNGKKFVFNTPIDGPGRFEVLIAIIDDLQEKHLVPEIRKKAGEKRNHRFEFQAWGDEMIGQASSKLNEVTALVNETRELVKKFERASMSKVGWE